MGELSFLDDYYRKIFKLQIWGINMVLDKFSQSGKPVYGDGNEEKPWNTSGDESFQEVGKEKIDALKKTVNEIKELIGEREELSRLIIQEAEKIKIDVNNFLAERKPIDSDGLKESIMLKQKQVEVSELQLKEKVSCWQDVAKLKQELREREKDLADKEGRLAMFGKILDK